MGILEKAFVEKFTENAIWHRATKNLSVELVFFLPYFEYCYRYKIGCYIISHFIKTFLLINLAYYKYIFNDNNRT